MSVFRKLLVLQIHNGVSSIPTFGLLFWKSSLIRSMLLNIGWTVHSLQHAFQLESQDVNQC